MLRRQRFILLFYLAKKSRPAFTALSWQTSSRLDFFPIQESDLDLYLRTVELSEVPGEDEIQRAKLLPHLRNAFSGGRRCFVLRRDERNKELFHEWGFVIWIFREFLFINLERDSLDRFVIGYD